MVDSYKCIVWSVLRFIELHRFYTNYQTCDVLPAFQLPHEFYVFEPPSTSWYLT